MTGLILGDTSQYLFLRRQTATTQGQLTMLTNALATGVASDRSTHLGGQTAPLAAIENRLTRLSTFDQTIARASSRADAMQAALGRVDSAARKAGSDLIQALGAGASALDTAAASGRASFNDAVVALNIRLGDRSLFAGTATDRDALLDPEALLAAARAAFEPATTPAEIATALDQWFDSPTGFLATAYRGSTQPTEVAVAEDIAVTLPVTAADADLRATLKGLTLAALMSDGLFAGDRMAQATLARLASDTLIDAAESRISAASRIGLAQERIATAQARNMGEATALGLARADLIAVDGYDAASRLKETETRLQTIYALTARLSELSLANYLR